MKTFLKCLDRPKNLSNLIFPSFKLQLKPSKNQIKNNGQKKFLRKKKTHFGLYINKQLKVILNKCPCLLPVSQTQALQDFGVSIREEINNKPKRIMLSSQKIFLKNMVLKIISKIFDSFQNI